MTSDVYQPRVDFCDTGRVINSHLPEQSIDRGLVKEETERKLPTIPSDCFVTKGMTSHVQSQHVSVTATTSTSTLTSNKPEKGMKNKQPIVLTQPGPITNTIELSQPSTMSSYPYKYASSSLSNVLSTSRHTCSDTIERGMLGENSA